MMIYTCHVIILPCCMSLIEECRRLVAYQLLDVIMMCPSPKQSGWHFPIAPTNNHQHLPRFSIFLLFFVNHSKTTFLNKTNHWNSLWPHGFPFPSISANGRVFWIGIFPLWPTPHRVMEKGRSQRWTMLFVDGQYRWPSKNRGFSSQKNQFE